MKKLRELRESAGFTQEQLAKMLDVSQQTIARWETGKVEPNISALRDLAMIFGASVDDLLGINSTRVTTNHYHLFGTEGSDGFWGHIGILFLGEEKTRWYPCTAAESTRINQILQDREPKESDWIVVETLNNRLLTFSLRETKRVVLLDDAVDPPENDWELPWDGYQGFPLEVYRALEKHFCEFDEEEYLHEYSEKFRETVGDLVTEHGIDEGNLYDRVIHTHVHFKDGTSSSYRVDSEDTSGFVDSAGLDMPSVIRLGEHEECTVFLPTSSIKLVDMPLIAYIDEIKRLYGEDADEMN